jgi:GntR family transcriptional regulator/MocR family aminotransferase
MVRRRRLLDWAAANDGMIIEDDYDGEFRFGVAPLPPLASLPGAGRVAYVGTFSKNLMPALRIGYVATRDSELTRAVADRKAAHNYHSAVIPQKALARFMTVGAFDRHVARIRRVYARRRNALAAAIAQHKLGTLTGLEAGLHAYLPLPLSIDVPKLVESALSYGVAVTDVRRYCHGSSGHHGIVLGFAAVPEPTITLGVGALAKALRGQTLTKN